MTVYTIEYNQTEELAMQYVTPSPNDWLQNVAHERARIAIDEIVTTTIQKFLDVGEGIPGNKEDIVKEAFKRGWVKTAIERQDEFIFHTVERVDAN